MIYTKTIYVDVEAADEDEAENLVDAALTTAATATGIRYIDQEGPLEEATEAVQAEYAEDDRT